MLRSLLAIVLLGLTAGAASAQDAPGRVGRLSYSEGNVLIHWGNQADWSPTTVNYPVTSGQSYWTDANSLAEIQIGPTEARLAQGSQLDVTRLDDATIVLQLDQGVLNLHLWQMPAGGISVVTRLGRVLLMAAGSYDIDAGDPRAGRLQVAVLQGTARLEGAGRVVDIRPSETAIVDGARISLAAAAPNAFDNWALSRERREVAAQQPGYVAPTVTGYQDLNQYGSWSQDSEYGGVWYPTAVPAGWAPYHDGHWAFVQPWGWTWIDDAPWGFAPFHYGRWIESRGRWGWVPGRLEERPVYAPALVAFIGGDGWGVDLAAGAAIAAIGWVALAPNEPYHPSYRASSGYVRSVNAANVNRTAMNNLSSNNGGNARAGNFRNRSAATVVPATAFTQAAPVQRAAVVVPPAQLAQVGVAPSLAHLRPGDAARSGRAVPAAAVASVPQANAPATVARTRVEVPPAPAGDPARVPDQRRDNNQNQRVSAPAVVQPVAPSVPAVVPPQQPVRPSRPDEANQRRPDRQAAPNVAAPAAAAPQAVAPAVSPPQAPAPVTPQAAVAPRPQPPAFTRPEHPEQNTHIAPNQQEWTRAPGAPRPEPQAAQPPRAAEHQPAAERPHPAPPSAPAATPAAAPAKPADDKRPRKDDHPDQH